MRARAPASSANLGPGFDTLAVAVDRYVSVEVEPAGSLSVRTGGRGGGALRRRHASRRPGRDGGARARSDRRDRALADPGRPRPRVLGCAGGGGGGRGRRGGSIRRRRGARRAPENAAASAFGGLVGATTVEGRPVYAPLPLSPDLAFVAMVPERNMETPQARTLLPETLSRPTPSSTWAAWRCCWPGSAGEPRLVSAAMDDRIHQPARTALPRGARAAPWPDRRRRAGCLLVGCRPHAPRGGDHGDIRRGARPGRIGPGGVRRAGPGPGAAARSRRDHLRDDADFVL